MGRSGKKRTKQTTECLVFYTGEQIDIIYVKQKDGLSEDFDTIITEVMTEVS